MGKKIGCGILAALAASVFLRPAGANKNFVPDWTFQGSSLASLKTLGNADWRAENGEIVGTPKTTEGGWLILDRPLQDVQFAASFRCTGGCRAGLMLRTRMTEDGIRGVYVALPDGQNSAGAFALKLDARGHEVNREALHPATGTVRVFAPSPDTGRGGAGRGPARAGGGAGFGPGGGRPDNPLPRPDYAFRPNEWNPLEVILDTNYLRVWVNDGPEAGTTNGQADDDVASYGPVALYVGGTGEVRFKQVEFKDLGRHAEPKEEVGSRFRMQHISEFYNAWSATAADFNHDGILDIAAGPYYYLGPDYTVFREIYPNQTSNVSTQYTGAMVNFAYDYTGDGWPDVLVASGRPMSLYVNPRGELRRWDKYNVLPTINSEVAVFKDIDGDGKPDVVFVGGGAVSWATPGADPTQPWIVHKVSQQGYTNNAQHGIGAGDINGDGRMDIVSPYGWWEQPPKGTPDGPWRYHPMKLGRWPRAGGSPGGAEMGVYDVNGDGLNDVVTSLEAHGWGLAWYEQKRDKGGAISFVEHTISEDHSTKNPGNVAFSEAHASTFADIDGDGIPDFVVGKRVYAHNESYTDPDPYGPAVLYWYRTVRNPKAPGGAEFVPELIHNRSGVGSTVLAVDLNKDGAMDVVTSTNRGTFIFWGSKPARKGAAGK